MDRKLPQCNIARKNLGKSLATFSVPWISLSPSDLVTLSAPVFFPVVWTARTLMLICAKFAESDGQPAAGKKQAHVAGSVGRQWVRDFLKIIGHIGDAVISELFPKAHWPFNLPRFTFSTFHGHRH